MRITDGCGGQVVREIIVGGLWRPMGAWRARGVRAHVNPQQNCGL